MVKASSIEQGYLVVFFQRTPEGWRNCLLRNSAPQVPLSQHLKQHKEKYAQTVDQPGTQPGKDVAPEVHNTFDADGGLELLNGDKGINVRVQNGELRVWGKTTDTEWNNDGISVPLKDLGGSFDTSIDFKLPKRENYGLVYMGLRPGGETGPPMILYQWHTRRPLLWFMDSGKSRGWYQVHTMWLKVKWWLKKGRHTYPDVGNEDTEFVTMRMYVRENRRQIDYYVNDVLVDTLNLAEPLGHVNKAIVAFQTPRTGYEYDIRFDNLKISSTPPAKSTPAQSPQPATQPSENLTFGPVIERVIYETVGNKSTIDFDTGKLYTGPEQVANLEEFHNWLETTGIDAVAMVSSAVHGLSGFDMIAMPLDPNGWDISPLEAKKLLSLGKAGTPALMSGKGQLPATYLFKTREGGMGILQIVGFTEKPEGVKIRYKMLRTAEANETDISKAETVTGRVIDVNGNGVTAATVEVSKSEEVIAEDGKKTWRSRIVATTEADEQGQFAISGISAGDTLIAKVSAPGFITRTAVALNLSQEGKRWPKDWLLQLKRVAILQGQVLGPDGKPLANAPLSLSTYVQYPHAGEVTANHLRAITDKNGLFRIKNVPPGQHLLFYPWMGPSSAEVDSGRWKAFTRHGQRWPSPPTKRVCDAVAVKLGDGEKLSDIVLDVSKSTCAVEGIVRDSAGSLVTNARVGLYWVFHGGYDSVHSPDFPPAVTDNEGRYRLAGLPPGEWHILAGHDQLKGRSKLIPVELAPNKTVLLNLILPGQIEN